MPYTYSHVNVDTKKQKKIQKKLNFKYFCFKINCT